MCSAAPVLRRWELYGGRNGCTVHDQDALRAALQTCQARPVSCCTLVQFTASLVVDWRCLIGCEYLSEACFASEGQLDEWPGSKLSGSAWEAQHSLNGRVSKSGQANSVLHSYTQCACRRKHLNRQQPAAPLNVLYVEPDFDFDHPPSLVRTTSQPLARQADRP